jgi:hypothetical protein
MNGMYKKVRVIVPRSINFNILFWLVTLHFFNTVSSSGGNSAMSAMVREEIKMGRED